TAHTQSTYTKRSANQSMNVTDDSSVNPPQTIINYRDGQKQYDIKMEGDKVTEIYVDHKKISPDNFYLYNNVINKIKTQIKQDKLQAEEDMKQAKLDMIQAKKDQEQAIEDMKQAELDKIQAQKDMQQAAIDEKQAYADKVQADKDHQQALLDNKQAMADMVQAKKDMQQAELDKKQAEEDRALVKSLIDDLVKAHIIPDETSLSNLTLNDNEFTINGKKQSEELHNKYKAKFLRKPGYSISYGGYTSGFGIYIKDYNKKNN
ncbi:MAG: hypothetical protein ABI921_15245, partial [Panacibacter sp.]